MSKLSLLFVILIIGCEGCPQPQPDRPWRPPTPITDSDSCKQACDHLAALGCDEAKPVPVNTWKDSGADAPATISCEQFCKETQAQGVWLNPKCVAALTSCKEIESCAVAK